MVKEQLKYNYSTTPFTDYVVYSGNLNDIDITHKTLINTINQYSYCIAQIDAGFKLALKSSDILLPDGVAIVAAVKLFTGQKIKKIAGADIHKYLLDGAEAVFTLDRPSVL